MEAEKEMDAAQYTMSFSVFGGRNLAAVHTLSVDNLLRADEMGGMPLPSVAVTRLDNPYQFGAADSITLVARPEMVDPSNGAEVYSRDAWTGRMPEIGEDGRFSAYNEYDDVEEKKEATLENLTEYMLGRKTRGAEATQRGIEVDEVARSYMARRLRTMEDVKDWRGKIAGRGGWERVTWRDFSEWMNMLPDKYEVYYGDEEWRGILQILADVEPVTEETVREALMGHTDADGAVDLWELQNSEALEPDSDFLKEAVRILEAVNEEIRGYLEAVPQRAVRMNEWAYAILPETLSRKDEVMTVLEKNGIKPIEYNAENGGRMGAFARLVNDEAVSFSVFSPAEASWLHALKALTQGEKEARFRSDTLGADVVLPIGSAGVLKNPDNPNSKIVEAFGFMHLISMRMAHGESLHEAAYTACKAVMAVVNGEVANVKRRGKTLSLDGYNGVIKADWQDSKNAWVITGYKKNGEKSSADDRRRALSLAESYALDSFGGLKEVGAALDYAIARLAREYKQNNADVRRKSAQKSARICLQKTSRDSGA